MKKKTIMIIAALLVLVMLATFMVACKDDEPEEETKELTPSEKVKEAVESTVRSRVLAKNVLGELKNWYYDSCTVHITENDDGTYSVRGTVYIYNSNYGNRLNGYGSYTAEVNAAYEVTSCELGDFYRY